MFKFLKDKLKKAVSIFSKGAEKDAKVVEEKIIVKEEKIKESVKPLKKPVKKEIEKKKEVETSKKDLEEIKIKEERKEEKKIKKDLKEPSIEIKEIKEKKKEEGVEKAKVEKVEEEIKEEKSEKRGFLGLFRKKEETKEQEAEIEEKVVADKEIKEEEIHKEIIEEEIIEKPKLGLFRKIKEKITLTQLSEEKFEELFWNLEVALLENNVAMEVIEKIKEDLKKEMTTKKIPKKNIEQIILNSLKESIDSVLDVEPFDLVQIIKKSKKPYKILFLGINGGGKTTTLAKIAKMLLDSGLSVVAAASDTFRAAAIDQLEEHCKRIGIKMISQGYNADPAAVAFDAVKHAESKGIDVVLIDTAGRLHSNINLMAELQKIKKVIKPDLKLFVGESITGNDCVEQAKQFEEMIGIDAIILTKADVDEKGGAPLSISYITKKPILYLGIGQSYKDLKQFDKNEILANIGLV